MLPLVYPVLYVLIIVICSHFLARSTYGSVPIIMFANVSFTVVFRIIEFVDKFLWTPSGLDSTVFLIMDSLPLVVKQQNMRMAISLGTVLYVVLPCLGKPQVSAAMNAMELGMRLKNALVVNLSRARFAMGGVDAMTHSPDPSVPVRYIAEAGTQGSYFVQTQTDPTAPCIVWLYGGAFIGGKAEPWKGFMTYIGKRSGCNALLVEYRLTPEHTIVEAVEDVTVAYKHLITNMKVPASKIFLSGVSSGGGLALLSVVRGAQKHELPLPAGVAMISPLLDFSGTTPSMTTQEAIDAFVGPEIVKFVSTFTENLIPQGEMEFWSAGFVPLPEKDTKTKTTTAAKFPKVFISASDRECCTDEIKNFVNRAEQSACVTECLWQSNLFHAFPVTYQYTEEGKFAIDALVEFFKRELQN